MVLPSFPDPWSSKKSSWRRLLSPEFVRLLNQRLVLHGCLHVVTDNPCYAQWTMDSILAADDCHFKSTLPAGSVALPSDHGFSLFRKTWEEQGRSIVYMCWRKTRDTTEECLAANAAFPFTRVQHPHFGEFSPGL
jgi:tRNA G46 methylase TrmB